MQEIADREFKGTGRWLWLGLGVSMLAFGAAASPMYDDPLGSHPETTFFSDPKSDIVNDMPRHALSHVQAMDSIVAGWHMPCAIFHPKQMALLSSSKEKKKRKALDTLPHRVTTVSMMLPWRHPPFPGVHHAALARQALAEAHRLPVMVSQCNAPLRFTPSSDETNVALQRATPATDTLATLTRKKHSAKNKLLHSHAARSASAKTKAAIAIVARVTRFNPALDEAPFVSENSSLAAIRLMRSDEAANYPALARAARLAATRKPPNAPRVMRYDVAFDYPRPALHVMRYDEAANYPALFLAARLAAEKAEATSPYVTRYAVAFDYPRHPASGLPDASLPWLAPAAGAMVQNVPVTPVQVAALAAPPLVTEEKRTPLAATSDKVTLAVPDAPPPEPNVPVTASPSIPAPALSSHAPAIALPETDEGLSPASKAIARHLPPEQPQRLAHRRAIRVEHSQKNDASGVEVKTHKALGISISVKRQAMDANRLLEDAYEALITGNQDAAIGLYRQVLESEPQNTLALFGLATTYHRAGNIKAARPLYGKLLMIAPHHVEGLNNFLVLLADESPSQALDELVKLEASHPSFSPIPAQMAAIYEKSGDYDNAVRAMQRAITLSPENLKYRYNMAVILDKSGARAEAAGFYEQLIKAADRGEKIPAKPEEIQERLTFIRSNTP